MPSMDLDKSDEPADSRRAASVAVLFRSKTESGGLLDLMTDAVTTKCATFVEHAGRVQGRPIVIAQAGLAKEKAQLANVVADVLAVCQPTWLISSGFASALDPSIKLDEIIFADSVANEDGNVWDLGLSFDRDSLQSAKGTHVGRLLSLPRRILDADTRRQMSKTHHAIACDAETASVAAACTQAKTKCLAIRSIIDSFESPLSAEVDVVHQQDSIAGKLGAAAAALVRRPGSAKDFWNLQEKKLKSSERLGKYLVSVIEQLPP